MSDPPQIPDVREAVVDFKRRLTDRARLDRTFQEVRDHVRREVDAIRADRAAGRRVIPEVDYVDIRDGHVPDSFERDVRRRGCAIVRRVFSRERARDWFDELGAYLDANRYEEREKEKRGLDQYFATLKAGKPQIFGIYWSKPQVRARQDESLTRTRIFLDGIWRHDGAIDPSHPCTYADRVRRREPGDTSLGLSAHIDGGSVERWIDPGFQQVYRQVFSGDFAAYDPFDATHRLTTREIPSPAVCSVFRTYQGWTALTRQGPRDGTLQLIPIANGIAYVLLRALGADVAEDDLCGVKPCRALGVSALWHPDLTAGLVSIPEVEPGDAVFWHTDVAHAVEDEHAGNEHASVIYIGSAPDCEKNRAYLVRQKEAFLAGRSAPDFAAEDYEVDFVDRATVADLTELGRSQMGI